MLTPTTIRTKLSGVFEVIPIDTSVYPPAKTFALHNERPDNDNYWIVGWNGHEFEVMPAELWKVSRAMGGYMSQQNSAREGGSVIYYPIDPRMFVKDIAGATIAYPNESNDGWLFAHCDKDFHIDHEHKLSGAVSSAFENQMHKLHGVLRSAMYSAFLSSTSDSRDAFGAASRAYGSLGDFQADVKARVLSEARKKHIGHYHQNPHDGHIHDPVEEAILHTARTWTLTKKATEWAPI